MINKGIFIIRTISWLDSLEFREVRTTEVQVTQTLSSPRAPGPEWLVFLETGIELLLRNVRVLKLLSAVFVH